MTTPSQRRKQQRRRRVASLEAALLSLDRSRGPLFREMDQIEGSRRNSKGQRPHLSCTKKFNRMRITDLEAIDIARAFREKPHLRGKLPEVYARLAKALHGLRDSEDPQAFDCPLLEGKKCMVHHVAKPIACLAWNPGRDYSNEGWHSFSRRDKLNTELFADRWALKAIPLQLSRYLEGEDRTVEGKCGSTLRKEAMRRGEIHSSADRQPAAEKAPRRVSRRGIRGAARFEESDQKPRSSKRGKEGAKGPRSRKTNTSTSNRRRGDGPSAGDRRAQRASSRSRRRAGGGTSRSSRRRP